MDLIMLVLMDSNPWLPDLEPTADTPEPTQEERSPRWTSHPSQPPTPC